MIVKIRYKIINKDKICNFIKANKYRIILLLILIMGVSTRLIAIDIYPNALNVDEASSGYESWSILNYGIDRNGKFLPVFLIAWGSGQNAFYSYLMMPFVAILGLNMWSLRLPMAIIGCISLIIMYLLLKELKDEKTALIGVEFFAICPWHIMKSRWALESNLFPEIILLAVYIMVLSVKNNKIWLFYISSILLRDISIFIWNFIFLFTIFCNSITNYIVKAKQDKNQRFHHFISNYYYSINANNIVCFNKYI